MDPRCVWAARARPARNRVQRSLHRTVVIPPEPSSSTKSAMGHEERFPPSRLSVRCRLGEHLSRNAQQRRGCADLGPSRTHRGTGRLGGLRDRREFAEHRTLARPWLFLRRRHGETTTEHRLDADWQQDAQRLHLRRAAHRVEPGPRPRHDLLEAIEADHMPDLLCSRKMPPAGRGVGDARHVAMTLSSSVRTPSLRCRFSGEPATVG
jgi:hypothetical protein